MYLISVLNHRCVYLPVEFLFALLLLLQTHIFSLLLLLHVLINNIKPIPISKLFPVSLLLFLLFFMLHIYNSMFHFFYPLHLNGFSILLWALSFSCISAFSFLAHYIYLHILNSCNRNWSISVLVLYAPPAKIL
jgi:hypothetical protein